MAEHERQEAARAERGRNECARAVGGEAARVPPGRFGDRGLHEGAAHERESRSVERDPEVSSDLRADGDARGQPREQVEAAGPIPGREREERGREGERLEPDQPRREDVRERHRGEGNLMQAADAPDGQDDRPERGAGERRERGPSRG
jgi:hypothetical protein